VLRCWSALRRDGKHDRFGHGQQGGHDDTDDRDDEAGLAEAPTATMAATLPISQTRRDL